MAKKHACTISADGKHVEPCEALSRECEYGNPRPKKRGIFAWQYFSRSSNGPTRTMFGAVTTGSPKGFLFNFCPYCGTKIDTPFAEQPTPTEERDDG